jgi:leader peptidase (prepilin peptidase) / N-methyltransferase
MGGMNLILAAVWAVAGAGGGLAAGLALRGEVVRLSVPCGAPEETSCGACAAPLPGLATLRCGSCSRWLGAPMAIELTTAAIIALLLVRFGGQPAVAAFAYLAVIGVALTQIDIAVQRLPDRLTLPAYPALVVLLAVAAAAQDNWSAFARALLGALAIGAGYVLLGLASRGQLGGGDIKLAGLTGLVLGWLSWHTLIAGACAGFLLAGLISAVLLVTRRISRRNPISFGPYLLGGALLAMLVR